MCVREATPPHEKWNHNIASLFSPSVLDSRTEMFTFLLLFMARKLTAAAVDCEWLVCCFAVCVFIQHNAQQEIKFHVKHINWQWSGVRGHIRPAAVNVMHHQSGDVKVFFFTLCVWGLMARLTHTSRCCCNVSMFTFMYAQQRCPWARHLSLSTAAQSWSDAGDAFSLSPKTSWRSSLQ